MKVFQNSFLTKEGQKERLTNVVDTIKSAVTGKGVKSNTGIKAVDTVLSTAASNPFAVATIATGASLGLAKSVGVATTNTKLVAGTLIGTPVVSSIVASKGVVSSAKSVGKSQSDIAQFSGNVYKTIVTPTTENLQSIYKDNPLIASLATAGAAYVVGKSVTGALVANKIASDKLPEVTTVLPKETTTTGSIIPSSTSSALVPITPETQIIGKSATSITKTRNKQKKKTNTPISRINVNVINGSRLFKSVKYIY